MESFWATLTFMGSMMLIMAVGVICKRPPLKGSCGGVGGLDCLCEKEGIPLGTCDLPESGQDTNAGDGVKLYS